MSEPTALDWALAKCLWPGDIGHYAEDCLADSVTVQTRLANHGYVIVRSDAIKALVEHHDELVSVPSGEPLHCVEADALRDVA